MPTELTFPLISRCFDRILCRSKGAYDEYLEVELPSQMRERAELKKLDEYFAENSIKVTENPYTPGEFSVLQREKNMKEHKLHDRLGFGYLAYFSTMRYMLCSFLVLAVLMVIPAGKLSSANLIKQEGFSTFFYFSIANLDYSLPVCIQQYATQNTTRNLDCGYGDGVMKAIISYGLIDSAQHYSYLTSCLDLNSTRVSSQVKYCSQTYLETSALETYFNANCFDQLQCDLNLFDFVLPQPTDGSDSQCFDIPARVYVQYYCDIDSQ